MIAYLLQYVVCVDVDAVVLVLMIIRSGLISGPSPIIFWLVINLVLPILYNLDFGYENDTSEAFCASVLFIHTLYN